MCLLILSYLQHCVLMRQRWLVKKIAHSFCPLSRCWIYCKFCCFVVILDNMTFVQKYPKCNQLNYVTTDR